MALLKNINFAYSLLIGDITDVDTGITVTTSDGSLFPSTGTFMAVIWGSSYASPGLDVTREIVEATFVSGDAFTISRGQEDTSAKAWSIGDNIACVLTAGKVDELETVLQNGVTSYCSVTGTNTLIAILSPILRAYESGIALNLKFLNLSTGAVTLNVNGLGAKKVYAKEGSSYTQLGAGHIKANSYGTVFYDASLDGSSGGWIFLELDFYTCELSSDVQEQITNLPESIIPSGTSMIFNQASAPVGWTKKNDWAANASIIIGNTYGSGGSDNPISWTTAVTAADHSTHTHTGPNHRHTGPSHTHTGPSHTHEVTIPAAGWETSSSITLEHLAGTATGEANKDVNNRDLTSESEGTGNTGSSGTGNTGYSGTDDTGAGGSASHTITQDIYTPLYQIMIAATRD